jgi:hypothetical protein
MFAKFLKLREKYCRMCVIGTLLLPFGNRKVPVLFGKDKLPIFSPLLRKKYSGSV